MTRHSLLATCCILCVLLVSGCATTSNGNEATRVEYDPYESLNRKFFGFNRAIDRAALQPLAKGYRKVMPAPIRRGFANIFDNFGRPRSALNNFLQGKPKQGFNELGRFLFNTTLGIGGIFDIATAGGMERYDESFSQTLAVWGSPEGPYLVLPVLGPRSLLDSAALPVDYFSDINTYLSASIKDKLYLFRLVDARARLLSAETLLEKSNDPYIALRESYRQNREFKIYDGDPPIDEEIFDDEIYEEFYEQN